MKLEEFLTALPELKDRFFWFNDDCGHLRGIDRDPTGTIYSTITALCKARTGLIFCLFMAWEDAADHLGLSFEDASAITWAEDYDGHCNYGLARLLRQLVGIVV